MLGSALKKLARENGMTISDGVAYGRFRGYAVTLSEGAGWKALAVSAHLSESASAYLETALDGRDLSKEFRVEDVQLMSEGIVVRFLDNPGTMKRVSAFLDWFFPLLGSAGVTGYDCCCRCGLPLAGNESWQLAGEIAFHIHPACADSLLRESETERQEALQEGSYGRGLLGALVGGIIGAIPWALLLYIGYFAAIAGLLIGLLANYFYGKFGGKRGPGKIAILLLAALIGVLLGTIGGETMLLIQEFAAEGFSIGLGEAISTLFSAVLQYSDARSAFLYEVIMGLVFALLGMAGTLAQAHRDTKSLKMKHLK